MLKKTKTLITLFYIYIYVCMPNNGWSDTMASLEALSSIDAGFGEYILERSIVNVNKFFLKEHKKNSLKIILEY